MDVSGLGLVADLCEEVAAADREEAAAARAARRERFREDLEALREKFPDAAAAFHAMTRHERNLLRGRIEPELPGPYRQFGHARTSFRAGLVIHRLQLEELDELGATATDPVPFLRPSKALVGTCLTVWDLAHFFGCGWIRGEEWRRIFAKSSKRDASDRRWLRLKRRLRTVREFSRLVEFAESPRRYLGSPGEVVFRLKPGALETAGRILDRAAAWAEPTCRRNRPHVAS